VFNHHNYARWAFIHLRDMVTLHIEHPKVAEQFAAGRFTVHKAFSAIALDHAHEQLNARMKGVGGAVGLTENIQALNRWMVAGPEIARAVEEFEITASLNVTLILNLKVTMSRHFPSNLHSITMLCQLSLFLRKWETHSLMTVQIYLHWIQ
jgi:hypothetical protein